MSDYEDKAEIDPYELIKSYVRQRASHKRKITLYIKDLQNLMNNQTLTISLCKGRIKLIDSEVAQVKQWDEEINSTLEGYQINLKDPTFADKELDGQAEYSINIMTQMDEFEVFVSQPSESKGVSAEKVLDMISKFNSDGKPPKLDCGNFNGTEKDKFAFNTFLNQFNNVIGSRKNLSKSAKQTYLYGYLRDYALKVVKHLPISDDNYDLALQMLKNEFLDVPYITDETFKNILNSAPTPEFDPEYLSVKVYLNEVKAYLYDLKAHQVDLLGDTAGNKFASHVIFNKLPVSIKRELVRKVGSSYPTLNEIFDNYNDVIKILLKTGPAKKSFSKPMNKSNVNDRQSSKAMVSSNKPPYKLNAEKGPSVRPKEKPTMQNFSSINKSDYYKCKLCSTGGHSIGGCPTFTSCNARIDRLKELGLCFRCAGSGHTEVQCYGKQNKLRFECRSCKRRDHITPLCPYADAAPVTRTSVNLCFAQRSFDGSNMLPTITLTLRNGPYKRKVRCMIDSGSQRSYISEHSAKDLCCNINDMFNMECEVGTYIGQDIVPFKQMSTGIYVNGMFVHVPLLIDAKLDIGFEVPGLNLVINKLKRHNIKFLDHSFYSDANHDFLQVDMLLGVDVIQYMTSGGYQEILGGTCFVLNNRASPIGNVFNFFTLDEQKLVMSSFLESESREPSDKVKTLVNLVMDPLKSYFNPLENILDDSEVDNGLEYLLA